MSDSMCPVKNQGNKRIGDLSQDRQTFLIQIKDCITKITANRDGTLRITHERLQPTAA